MQRRAAEIISAVFHPLILTTLLVAMLFLRLPEALPSSNNDVSFRLYLLLLIFLLNYAIPLISLGVLTMLGAISNLYLRQREERPMPFFFIGGMYALSAYLFYSRPFGDVLLGIFVGVTLLIFCVATISFFLKISVHAAGTWGMFGCLLAINMYYPDGRLLLPMVCALLLAGLVSAARLLLNEHSPREVHLGAAIGFVVCFTVVFLML